MPLVLNADMPDIPPPKSQIEAVAIAPGGDAASALVQIEPRIRELASDAWAIVIQDHASYQAAADLLTEVKGMSKQFDGLESLFVTPLGTAWKKAKAIFKPLSELLKAVEKHLKEAGKTYLEAEGAKENQAAAARRAEAIASAPTPQAAAQIASVPAYVAPPPKAIGMSATKPWTYEVENIQDLARAVADGVVPTTFIQPNAGQLQAAVRSGTRAIPGVRIYQEIRMASR
jgi:hypothetical protein